MQSISCALDPARPLLFMTTVITSYEEVDEIAFKNLNEEIIQKLIKKTGPQIKFLTRWKREFGVVVENVDRRQSTSEVDIANFDLTVDDDSSFPLSLEIEKSFAIESQNFDFSKIDNADLSVDLRNPITDLVSVLRTSATGLSILSHYKSHRNLPEDFRNDLVDFIISIEICTSPELVISPARFVELSQLIVDLFPTEVKETYYIPYSYDKATKSKILPKGKFHSKYNNGYRANLLASGAIVKKTATKRKRNEISGSVHLGFTSDLKSELTDEEYAEKVKWLKENIDSWAEVKKLWADTSKKRISHLLADTSMNHYIESFTVLKHVTNGPQLIDIDFLTIHPKKTLNLSLNFDLFAKQLVSYSSNKKRKSEVIQLLLKKISSLSQSEDLNSTELKKVSILKLLPLLLPAPGPFQSITGTLSPWRPSKDEVQKGFILHVKDELDLRAELKNRRDNLKNYGLTEQPIVSVVGMSKIESYNVHVNNITYQLASVLEAVDIAFKSFYAFQLSYPKESEYSWMVLQQKIYGIKGEKDGPVLPCIRTFITDLNNCKV
ncbi:hypothetical protein KQX54_004478 [Cotesia glomerata]|uniref:Uncharacterized protein n=1 Tax=Cotesia glomerata TaxID=32391 RepID=A0AAV7IJJ9_COTGL|nr:hypothetical protein KQX54_004478 [Cotesia glomerata]